MEGNNNNNIEPQIFFKRKKRVKLKFSKIKVLFEIVFLFPNEMRDLVNDFEIKKKNFKK